jgi:hypothetical protein
VACGSFHTLVVGKSSSMSKIVEVPGVPTGAEEDMEVSGDNGAEDYELICSFGQGNYGGLGNRSNQSTWRPQQVLLPRSAKNISHRISAGTNFSVVSRGPSSNQVSSGVLKSYVCLGEEEGLYTSRHLPSSLRYR